MMTGKVKNSAHARIGTLLGKGPVMALRLYRVLQNKMDV
jgi:hypothetical protein